MTNELIETVEKNLENYAARIIQLNELIAGTQQDAFAMMTASQLKENNDNCEYLKRALTQTIHEEKETRSQLVKLQEQAKEITEICTIRKQLVKISVVVTVELFYDTNNGYSVHGIVAQDGNGKWFSGSAIVARHESPNDPNKPALDGFRQRHEMAYIHNNCNYSIHWNQSENTAHKNAIRCMRGSVKDLKIRNARIHKFDKTLRHTNKS